MTARPWQRARSALAALVGTGPAASAALGLLVFGCVFLAVVAPRESQALRTRALQAELSHIGPMGRSVYATIPYSAFEVAVGQVYPAAISDTQFMLRQILSAEGLPLAAAATQWSGLTSGLHPFAGGAPALYADGRLPPQVAVLYRDRLSGHAVLASGRLPDHAQSGPGGAVFEVAVTQANAARLGLTVGSRLRIGGQITLVVTGILRATGQRSAFWTANPSALVPQLEQKNANYPPYLTGGAFIGPDEVGLLESEFSIADLTLSWDYPLELGPLRASQATNLLDKLQSAESQGGQLTTIGGNPGASGILSLASGVSGALASFIAQDQAVGTVLSMLSVSLTAVAAVVVLLGAFLIAEQRNAELAIMRARGASRGQLAWTVFLAGAAVSVPAAVAGAALAVALTPGDGASLSWWLAGFTVLAAVAAPPAAVAVRLGHGRVTAGPRPRLGPVRRLVTEIALTAAAISGLVLLRQQSQPGSDLYSELAPVCLAIPAALLVMRCYPVVLRLLIKLSGRLPGATAFVGLARAARVAPQAILPAFALVLALSAVGYGTMVRAAVGRSDVTSSWRVAGGDARINAGFSANPVTPAVVREVRAVPGVQRVATVAVIAGQTNAGQQFIIAAVNPAAFAAFLAGDPLPAFPAAKLALPAGARRGTRPFPALATPGAAAALGAASVSLNAQLSHPIAVKVTGVITAMPGVPGQQGAPVVVVPFAAVGSSAAANVIVLTGSHIDDRRLAAVVRRRLPGATVVFRSSVLRALTAAPVPNGAYAALALGALAAAGLIVIVVLIGLVLGARSREHTLVRLEVMGLAHRQARWLVTSEVLPQVLVAAVGGLACAAALAPVVAPAVDLSPLTGSPVPVPVSAQPFPLAVTVAGLIVVALLTVGAQAVVAGRQAAGRVLRVEG